MSFVDKKFSVNLKPYEFEMELYIYPVALCGEDVSRGEPLEVKASGHDLHKLKLQVNELILLTMSSEGYDGECFVEMRVTERGNYHSSDEWWAEVDLVNKKVEYKGGYV